MKTILFLTTFFTCFTAISPTFSDGQVNYPVNPIQILVGFPPGGSIDILGRALAQEARKYLGQEIVIVNKPGAGGTVSVNQVVNSKPDGYTLGISPSIPFTCSPFFLGLRVDLVKECTPILSLAKFNVGIIVKSDSPFNNLKDFMRYAKQSPGKLTYGFPGVGSKPHLVMEMMVLQERTNINFVPFAGDAPVVSALLGGHITMGSGSAGGWVSHIQAGTLRLIAVMEDERMDLFPEIQTVVELGYPASLPNRVFLYGPRGLSEPVVKRLEDAVSTAIQSSIYKKVAIDNALYEKKIIVREELASFLIAEKTKTGEFIHKLGLGKK